MSVAPTSGTNADLSAIATFDELVVKQTRRGWCQEMLCGCEAKTEFNVIDPKSKNKVFYILEESSFCIRLCCGTARPFTMNMHVGEDGDGPLFATFDKPFTCVQPGPCKCCCKHHIIANSTDGTRIGKTEEGFYVCVPSLDVYESGSKQYSIEKGGCCPCAVFEFCAQPFVIKDTSGSTVGEVNKKFGGWQELFTDADTFQVKFPSGAGDGAKVNLIASVMLLNQLFFESDKDKDQMGGAPPKENEEMER